MKELLCVCMLSVAMVLSSVPTFARADLCSCGGTWRQTGYSYSTWGLSGKTRGCSHNKKGTDVQKKRNKTTNYKCSGCGLTMKRTATEYKWDCQGYTS